MRHLKKIVKAHLPVFAIKWIVHVRRKMSTRLRRAKRVKMREFSVEDLMNDLKSAGIRRGDTIMVHSSLSSIGNVQGGPDTVIKSLMEVMTQDGTILMPAYGSAEVVVNEYKHGKYVDLRTIRSESGKITEKFQTWPNVYRSSHPFSSVCAWGKNAEYVSSDHDIDPRICHKDSPIARLVELNGKVVGIGVTLGPVSIYHVIEDTWADFPFKVHTNAFSIKYVDNTGNTVMRDVVRYDPFVSLTRIDHADGEWIREKFTYHLAKKGFLKYFHLGNADLWIMNAQPLYSELKRLAEKGITIYLTRDKWMAMNGGNESIDSW